MAQEAINKCELCNRKENVEYFCMDCDEILCLNCKVCHAKSKKSRNDKIISLSEAKSQGIVHKSTTLFCIEHSTVEITLFCLKCNQIICTQCLTETHNGHNIATLDKVRDTKIQELYKLMEVLKEKQTSYQNAFDVQGKVHTQVRRSIDQVRNKISDQKAKIIEELNDVCDEQFNQLDKFQHKEDKKYDDVCNDIQSQCQVVKLAIQAVQNGIHSNNTALIIQTIVNTARTIYELEDPIIPSTSEATYQTGDRSRPSILHVQGKVNIEQEFQKPETNSDIKQRHGAMEPRVDLKKVKVKSTITVKNKGTIHVIVPLRNNTAWIKAIRDKHLSLINSRGKIISKSVKLAYEIRDAKEYMDALLLTCYNQSEVIKMSKNGKSTSTFSKFSAFKAWGLCVTQSMEVFVCLQSTKDDNDNKVVELNRSGDVIRTLQYDVIGAPLYRDPWKVTSLTTGEIIVRDGERIVGVDSGGNHLFTWQGELQGKKSSNYSVYSITHDNINNLFVTDFVYNKVYVLGKDGSGAMCFLDNGIKGPCEIVADKDGKLWIGSDGGKIHVIEY